MDGDILIEVYDKQPNSFPGATYPPQGDYLEDIEQGLFSYYIKVKNVNGDSFEIEGTVCSYNCSEGFPMDNIGNCGFGLQHNGNGELDPSFPNGEDCFL